jgi:hypothetical protein
VPERNWGACVEYYNVGKHMSVVTTVRSVTADLYLFVSESRALVLRRVHFRHVLVDSTSFAEVLLHLYMNYFFIVAESRTNTALDGRDQWPSDQTFFACGYFSPRQMFTKRDKVTK